MARAAHEIEDFFAGYPEAVNGIALELRRMILGLLPEAVEMLDRTARVVGYGFGTGYSDMICTIIPGKSGVKLGIARGAELPDPDGLLQGSGKVHRYVDFRADPRPQRAAVTRLLRAAVEGWRSRREAAGPARPKSAAGRPAAKKRPLRR